MVAGDSGKDTDTLHWVLAMWGSSLATRRSRNDCSRSRINAKFQFDVFDPAFHERLHDETVAQCREFAHDPWVIGVTYVDLPVWDSRRVDFFRALPEDAPGRRRYEEYVRNAKPPSDEEFLGIVAEELYPHMRAAVKTGAPNHLFLGERFVLRMAPEPVLRAVGRAADVFCTQSLILSPHRPPERQVFQPDGYHANSRSRASE